MSFTPHVKICPRCNKGFIQSKISEWCCRPCRVALSKQEYEKKKEKRAQRIRLYSPVIVDYDPDDLYRKGAEFPIDQIPGHKGSSSIDPESFSPGTIILSGEDHTRCIYDGKLWQVMG